MVLARRQLATQLSCEVKHGVSHIFIWQIAASDSGNRPCATLDEAVPQHSPIQPFSAERRGAGLRAVAQRAWKGFARWASPAGHGGGRRNRGATGGSCSAVPRAPLSQKPGPSARGLARAALDGSLKNANRTARRRLRCSPRLKPPGPPHSIPALAPPTNCRCPTRCPPRRREVDATAAPVT